MGLFEQLFCLSLLLFVVKTCYGPVLSKEWPTGLWDMRQLWGFPGGKQHFLWATEKWVVPLDQTT